MSEDFPGRSGTECLDVGVVRMLGRLAGLDL